MLKTEERVIDGRNFTVTQFPARAGANFQVRLARMVMPSIGALAGRAFSGMPTEADLLGADLDLRSLEPALAALADRLPENFAAFAMELLQSTRLDGQEITAPTFDMEFAGSYGTLYKALGFVIEVNGFFPVGAIGGLVARFAEKQQAARAPIPESSRKN